jgi:signal peptidase
MLRTRARNDEGGDRVPALVTSAGAADPIPVGSRRSSAASVALGATGVLRWAFITLALTVTGGSILITALGYRVMVVTSGSMAPSIDAGDAVLVGHSGSDGVEVGDVITFRGYGSDDMTTHRVLKAMTVQGELHFQTKGDANSTPDPNLAPGDGVYGKVGLRIPALGEELYWATTPKGKLFLLAFPVLTILIEQIVVLAREGHRREPSEALGSAAQEPVT